MSYVGMCWFLALAAHSSLLACALQKGDVRPVRSTGREDAQRARGKSYVALDQAGSLIASSGKGRSGKGSSTTEGSEDLINIEFGGDEHKDTGEYLSRPEAVKSEACDENGCEDCTTPGECWHGITAGGWGWIEVNPKLGADFTHYVAVVYATCPDAHTAHTEWWVEVGDEADNVNGKIEIKVDGVIVNSDAQPGKKIQLPIDDSLATSMVAVTFEPFDKTQISKARVWIEAYRVDPSMDSCMSTKNCLRIFGEHANSEVAYDLQNSNAKQLQCLQDPSSMPTLEQELCQEWEECVTTSGIKAELLTLLMAAGVGTHDDALVQTNNNGTSNKGMSMRKRDSGGDCVDPSIDSPETWDCNCAQGMSDYCARHNYTGIAEVSACMRTLMCHKPAVCCSWKKDHCSEPLVGCDEEALWAQVGESSRTCTLSPQATVVENRRACQELAVANGHEYYEYEASQKECSTVATCDDPVSASTEWRIYQAPTSMLMRRDASHFGIASDHNLDSTLKPKNINPIPCSDTPPQKCNECISRYPESICEGERICVWSFTQGCQDAKIPKEGRPVQTCPWWLR